MTKTAHQFVAFVAPFSLVVGVLTLRAAGGDLDSPSLWWGVATGVALALGALASGLWRMRRRSEIGA